MVSATLCVGTSMSAMLRHHRYFGSWETVNTLHQSQVLVWRFISECLQFCIISPRPKILWLCKYHGLKAPDHVISNSTWLVIVSICVSVRRTLCLKIGSVRNYMKARQKLRKGIILFSFFLFPVIFYYLSPVVIIRATLEGIINGSFIIFLLMFISALILGRAYCGWVCPAAGCQEAIFLSRDKKITKGDFIKWTIWIPWISAIVILAVKVINYSFSKTT